MKKKKNIHFFGLSWNSTTDGSGIRTVIYLQGCNLQCSWCHSPHSQTAISPILFNYENCVHCKKCEEICNQKVHEFKDSEHRIKYQNCISCGECISNCAKSNEISGVNNALYLPTKSLSAKSLFNKVFPQLDLLRNIGGLTLSGGEPLLQFNEIKDFLKECKLNNIHTTIETSASVPFSNFEYIYDFVDEWLYGIRPVSNTMYKNKGQNLNLVQENLEKLSSLNNKNITVRTPIIKDIIDSYEQMEQIINIMQRNQLDKIELLPYNPYTRHYYNLMGKDFTLGQSHAVNPESLKALSHYFQKKDIDPKIINIT